MSSSSPAAEPSLVDPKAIKASDVAGLKLFKRIRPMLDSLHDIGTSRDVAGNRKSH